MDTIGYNFVKNACLDGNLSNGHSQGAITYSNYSINTYVIGNRFLNGRELAFGLNGADDGGNIYTGNIFDTFRGLTAGDGDDIIYEDNIIVNIGKE